MPRVAAALFLLVLAGCSKSNSTAPTAADLPAGSETGVAPPRYRLEVGQELVYQLTASEDPRESNDAKNEEGHAAARNQMEWRIVVARQNEDGSWRLYIRTKITFVNRDGSVRGKHDSFGYCDLRSDGSYSVDEQTAVFKKLVPHQLFCRLPDTAAALDNGWTYEPPVFGKLFTFSLAKRAGTHWHIAGVQKGVYSEAGKDQSRYLYDFDAQRGLVVSIDSEWIDLAADQVKNRSTFQLTSSARRDSTWVAQFYEEAEKYLDVHAKWMGLCYEGLRARTVEACQVARVKARALLVAGREQAELDVIRDLYDATIESHDNDEIGHLHLVKKREEFFRAAPEFPTNWEAKNLDGSTFRLTDHRGKVLVLFFWTTGCEYNVLLGPQICQLAADYQGKDVAIIGMFVRSGSTDEEEARAKHFIAKSFRGFPHLEAKDIPVLYHFQQYELQGYYPSILVLDQAGRVHDVHTGYAADHGQCIRRIVEDLRSKPPAKTE
jgi:thiol-disulfide isomerase/thioredoxin